MEVLNRFYIIKKLQHFFKKKRFSGNWIILKLLKILEPVPEKDMVVKTLYGFYLSIDPIYDMGIERRIFQSGRYEAGTLRCFDFLIKKGDIVIDAGANIGLTSIYASRITGPKGKIYGFEPLGSTYDIFCKNILLNNVKNIIPVPLALSNFSGKCSIYPNLHINRGAASLNRSDIAQTPYECNVTTLDHWLIKNNISNINFMKIDVEGSEYELLTGASKIFQQKIKPTLCVEYSREVSRRGETDILFQFLKEELGYRLFKSRLGKEEISELLEIKLRNDLPQHDNIYCIEPDLLKELPSELFDTKVRI